MVFFCLIFFSFESMKLMGANVEQFEFSPYLLHSIFSVDCFTIQSARASTQFISFHLLFFFVRPLIASGSSFVSRIPVIDFVQQHYQHTLLSVRKPTNKQITVFTEEEKERFRAKRCNEQNHKEQQLRQRSSKEKCEKSADISFHPKRVSMHTITLMCCSFDVRNEKNNLLSRNCCRCVYVRALCENGERCIRTQKTDRKDVPESEQ